MLTKAQLSAETLAAVLAQSSDCVKLVDLAGNLLWMNPNGLCAMEIDSFETVEGRRWSSLWPADGGEQIEQAYGPAGSGETVRFTAFCPTAKGTPRWWDVSICGVTDRSGALVGYLGISRDITQAEHDREALAIITREMQHRLGNAYALVCGLLSGVARGDPANERFAADMIKRINALGKVQTLFADDRCETSLSELVATIVQPFASDNCPVSAELAPGILIGKRAADAVSLVLCELAVNSGKHGAVRHGGSIALTGLIGDGRLRLTWLETCTRAPSAHERPEGQGLALIHAIVAAHDGSLGIEWVDCGLNAQLDIAPA